MKQQRISGKEAARVAEDMAKPGPIRVVARPFWRCRSLRLVLPAYDFFDRAIAR
jgi:hypothetical protein